MSFKESEEINSLPDGDRKKVVYSYSKTNATQTGGNRFSKSASLDIADGYTSDLQRTKATYEAHISDSNSLIPKQLRKTISCGGINIPSTSKIVLRRWTSSLNEREESISKRHSSSTLYQGSRGEKVLFRPVSSILLSTPWEKDFKGNTNKLEADNGKKAYDIIKINKRQDTVKERLINLNSCWIDKHEGSKALIPGNEIACSDPSLNSSSGRTFNNVEVPHKLEDRNKKSIEATVWNGEGCTRDTVNRDHPSSRLTEDRKVGNANYELNKSTAIPQSQRTDYNSQIVKFPSKHNIYEKGKERVVSSNLGSNELSSENMPLSTGSYYYKSKYGTESVSNEPSFRRGNVATYARRVPDTSYTSTFTTSRTLNTVKSGKETVAEVDAYISAYKSRRERSFDYGDTGYQSYAQARTERKPSLDRSTPLYQSQATRTVPSGFPNSLPPHPPASSSTLETGRQRHAYSRALEKDYSLSRPSRFLSKTDRSKSFDVEPMVYSSLTRTSSGGRYPRRNITPTGSSSSSSKTQSPPEKENKNYDSRLVSTKSSGTGSILLSDTLTPYERNFFSTSRISDESIDKSTSPRRRKSSLDSSKFHPGNTRDTPKQRPLSLIGKLSQSASYRNDKPLEERAKTGTDNDMSSRSRIMGGILSRFFTEEEAANEVVVPTEPTAKENKTDSLALVDNEDNERHASVESKPERNDMDLRCTADSSDKQIPKSDGDSTNDLQSSPSMMSKDRLQSVPKSGQVVRVKSVFVEEGDTEAMGKDKAQKSAQKTKASSIDGSKGLKEAKEPGNAQQSRERHSSWIGRSLRRISSSSKTTSEEPLEKTEKPKRERRRSLLWRLGRDSKSIDVSESVAEDSGAPDDIIVAKPYDAKDDRKGGKKEERKKEKKDDKKEDKKEDKGIANYLRRSSRRKKSQVSEREILEARQETQTKLQEESHAIEQERHLNSTEISQLETDVRGKDAAEKHDIQVNEIQKAAPLAQAEDSGDDMSSDNIRKSRFAEVLRQKEAAAKESQRSAASSKGIDNGPKKAATNSTSSYLSSKFMKSRTMFEGKNEKSSVEARKGATVSQPRSRRFTQETVNNNERNETAKVDTGKERFRAGIDGKRALFQKANSTDVTKSSDTGRVPLRERNKDLPGSTSVKKETASIELAPEESITGATSKLPVRRLVSDSVLKLRSGERSEEEKAERVREIYEETKMERKKEHEKEHEKERMELVNSEMVGSDISESIDEKKIEAPELQVHNDKKLQEAAENGLLKKVSGNAADDVVSSRKPLNDITEQSLLLGKNADLKYENEALHQRRSENTEVLHKAFEESENTPGDQHESLEMTNGPKVEETNFSKNLDSGVPQIVVAESQAELASDNLPGKEVPDETEDSKEIVGERIGSRRRRERRAHRMKQVDPLEIEKVKEQMRRENTISDHADLNKDDKSLDDRPKIIIDESIEQGIGDGENSMLGAKMTAGMKEGDEKHAQEHNAADLAEVNNLDDAHSKLGMHGRDVPRIGIIIDEKLSETDTGDESTGSSGSATKLTTRSVIKDKIRQKKFDKQLRKERTLSLPIGVEIVVTPPIEKKPALSKEVNGTRSPLLRTKPPVMPKIQRSQEADDVSKLQKKTKRPLRSRPKTLTQGIDPSLLVSDMKAKEEAVVVEERLSISQLKQRLMQSESGSKSPRTPDVQRKNKRRSGKRYKTITEGIAPGLLEAAHQLASHEQDPNRLGIDQMNKLNMALSASTENLKRRSFIVSEVNSRIGSVGASLATSMEDLSMKENGLDNERVGGSVVEESIKKLKKLPMVVDSDEDDPMPSVSSLKQKFMQAVEDSYKPVKNKVTKRAKGRQRDRPFTISGLDDVTMLQLRHSIDERNERNIEEKAVECTGDTKVEKGKAEKIDELAEDELEDMLKAEGLTADQLASELGINPSLAQGSPLRARKPFLGTTTEESADDVLEVIHETSEKQEKDAKPLGELRNKFMDAMNEFKSGSFDKETDAEKSMNTEEKEPNARRKERRIGVVDSAERISIELIGEDEPKSDLDFVSQNVTQLQSITDRRHLKPQRKQRSSANPVKTLQARNDLITEVGSNKPAENKDIQSQGGTKSAGMKLWRKVALANEAKAALQSTEDFSKVKLKRVKAPGQSMNGEPAETGGIVESKITNLLLQIKGRRHVQIHVVEFDTNSLSSDDSYVIVTPKDLLCWHGKTANVIEKAKASEIASRINQKKEMGCKAFDVVYFEQDGPNDSRVFRALGSEGNAIIKDETENDEEYERKMMNSSMVYSLQDSDPPELIPVYDMCQRSPSKEILKTDEAFVFDFVSEVYVWIGRQTTSGLRKKMMKLGRERFDMGYYKSPSSMTPIHHGKSRKISLTATELPTRKQSIHRKLSVSKFVQDKENLVPRPSCAIFLSMFEGAEWVIFKEKFCDWPDESRIIRMKGGPQNVGELTKTVRVSDVKPVDPLTMLTPKFEPHLPTFEGTEIDRGQGRPKGPDGHHIITRCVQVWHVTERSRTLLPDSSNGQFHSGEGFVIRWEYSIVASRVMKMLKDLEEAKAAGRHRCAYFFWLGNDCAVTEQGATAVMTVDLDEERGPHVRVIQGKEPPCFLNLFDGGMVIHAGKRRSKLDRATFSDRSIVRFYCVRSEIPSEACLLQVPVCASSLRSRSSFVLVLCKQGEIFLWHGCKSSDSTRATAIQAAHRLIENHPEEALLAEKDEIFLTEIDEGHEPEVFWVALGGEDYYGSLSSDLNTKWDFVPRCFHLTSATGQFIANEVINPSINAKEVCPFPFLQDDLYDAYQPAIFIIDAINEVYLWLGWWPEDEESENSDAQRIRWDVDKKKAMESVILYAKEAGRSLSYCYVVDAGLEPEQFIHLFPYWIVQEDITEIQIEDGRIDSDKLQLITKKLEGFTREFFSIDELIQRPLPEGVNPSKLETYLSDEDFFTVFTMDREEFKNLPIWRRDNLKKSVGLY